PRHHPGRAARRQEQGPRGAVEPRRGHPARRGVVPGIGAAPLPRAPPGSRAVREGDGWGKRLGVMGGTFDPIHHGHLLTAEEALQQFDLDEVVFVPTGQPWMKQDREVSPAEHRYLMVVIATASNPRFSVSRLEIERAGPTYAVDTLKELRGERGEDIELFFITG